MPSEIGLRRNRGQNLRKVSDCEDADIYLRVLALQGVRTVPYVTETF